MSKLTGRLKKKSLPVYKVQRTYKGYGGGGKARGEETVLLSKNSDKSIVLKHKKK